MPMSDLIALDLKERPASENPSLELRGLIARALAVVRELVAAEEQEEDASLLGELEHLAVQYGIAPPVPVSARAGLDCLERTRPLASRAKERRTEQRSELTAIVALVREAVAAAGMELDSIHSEIEASGSRFEAIATLEDPKQVKNLVMAHVALLKQLVVERRKSWETQRQTFGDRITALEQQLRTTRQQASMDALTGVANQGSFQAEYEARVRRTGSRLILAILDVDGFKTVNDSYGHPEGDRVLKAVAQGLRRALRDNDFVARVGGDEFAALLDNVTLRQAEVRFTSILAALRTEMAKGGDPSRTLGVSCGLAELSAGDSTASLYERADQALYAAKRAGRHRVACKTRPLMRDLMRR